MLIRPFEQPDRDAVVAVWRACGLTRPWNDASRDIDRKLTTQPELFLVALEEGALVGSVMAGYDGHRGWLNYLAVQPESQGQGVARVLVREAERQLQDLGCAKVNLQVRADNPQALGFYAALGYSRDDVVSLGRRLIPDE